MRSCRTCGMPLLFAWLLFGWPWQRRWTRFADATDCIDVLPYGV